MISKRWAITVGSLCLGAVSAIACVYMVHTMTTPPKGFSAAPNPSPWGLIQLLAGVLSTGGFTFTGLILAVLNMVHPTVGSADGKTKDTSNQSLADLIQAFPVWVKDRSNPANSRRFWLDVIDVGIGFENDPEIKAWLQAGVPVLSKKWFPPSDVTKV